MMNKHLAKIPVLAVLILLFGTTGNAQSKSKGDNDNSDDELRGYDEIIIKRKSDKNSKVTIEIKDGKVYVDGKPATDYTSDDLSVRKRKIRVQDGRTFGWSGPDGDGMALLEPGRGVAPRAFAMPRNRSGVWSYEGNSNQAFLGVSSEKVEGGPGAKVTRISDKSAAEKSGLKIGDVITRVDEIAIDGPESLSEAIHKYKPEDKVTLTIKRDGKEQKISVTLGKTTGGMAYGFNMPDHMPELERLAPFGGGSYNFSFNAGPRLGIKAQDTEEGKGVKVLDVDDESAAGKAGIKEGDIITRFDGKEVNSATELAELAQAAKGKPSIKVSVTRDGKSQEMEIKIPKRLRTANL